MSCFIVLASFFLNFFLDSILPSLIWLFLFVPPFLLSCLASFPLPLSLSPSSGLSCRLPPYLSLFKKRTLIVFQLPTSSNSLLIRFFHLLKFVFFPFLFLFFSSSLISLFTHFCIVLFRVSSFYLLFCAVSCSLSLFLSLPPFPPFHLYPFSQLSLFPNIFHDEVKNVHRRHLVPK